MGHEWPNLKGQNLKDAASGSGNSNACHSVVKINSKKLN